MLWRHSGLSASTRATRASRSASAVRSSAATSRRARPGPDLLNGECSGATPPFVLRPDDLSEVCDGLDNDCDGVNDDNPIDAGGACGSSVGNCQIGTQQCVTGALQCVGDVGPQPDLCNAQDDDCDGVIDGQIPPGGAAHPVHQRCAVQLGSGVPPAHRAGGHGLRDPALGRQRRLRRCRRLRPRACLSRARRAPSPAWAASRAARARSSRPRPSTCVARTPTATAR